MMNIPAEKKLKVVRKPNQDKMSAEEYEIRHRAWRRYIIESVVGCIKDTEQLDREIKARRASEIRASKKLANW